MNKFMRGSLAIVSAEMCFYMATVVTRRATTTAVALNSESLTFARFLLGFLIFGVIFLAQRKLPRSQHYGILIGRAVFNTIAVASFFKAVEVTSVAAGNLLNMTYPIFIAIISWFVFRAQRDRWALAMTGVAFAGILLVLSPWGTVHLAWNNLWGLTSGVTAAIAIIFLSLARQQNDTDTILLFMFGGGTLLLGVFGWKSLHWPVGSQIWYLLACGGLGVIGQYFLTLGYRHVTAMQGGVLSLSRILYAALLGRFLTSDPPLALSGWIGALLILGANLYFIVRKS
jgi:drug/metabolite transporter (DMT)-like permease